MALPDGYGFRALTEDDLDVAYERVGSDVERWDVWERLHADRVLRRPVEGADLACLGGRR